MRNTFSKTLYECAVADPSIFRQDGGPSIGERMKVGKLT